MTENFRDDLLGQDKDLLWHPFSQHGLGRKILPVISAQGSKLRLADGRELIDGISSWWVNLHGHSHPEIVEAIRKQAATLDHVIFSGFTHSPAVELASAILSDPAMRKSRLARAFYSDNGSTAVEVALKMSFQFHFNRGDKARTRFLALRDSYHGDTLGAMSVGEPEGYHTLFKPLLPEVNFVQPGDLEGLKKLLREHGRTYAAFILEPLLQGAGGMKIYSAEFLRQAVDLCRSEGVLTICDEIFTGFYRTGLCFAFEHAGIRPDLVCLSKGITGGFLPLSVTLCTDQIFQTFLSQEMRTAFLHGHSYTANPIACAAGVASWKILQRPETLRRISRITELTSKFISELKGRPGVRDARCLGTIGAVELESQATYFTGGSLSLLDRAIERGVLLRPLGNVLYCVPPYCVSDEELARIYSVMGELI